MYLGVYGYSREECELCSDLIFNPTKISLNSGWQHEAKINQQELVRKKR